MTENAASGAKPSFKSWSRAGGSGIWLTAGAIAICLLLVAWLIGMIAVNGLMSFYPRDVIQAQIGDEFVAGEIVDRASVDKELLLAAGVPLAEDAPEQMERWLLKVGNRDVYGSDFRWLLRQQLQEISRPEQLYRIERMEWGNMYGEIVGIYSRDEEVARLAEGASAAEHAALRAELEPMLERVSELRQRKYQLEKSDIGAINYQIEQLRLQQRRLELEGEFDAAAERRLQEERALLDEQFSELSALLSALQASLHRDSIRVRIAGGDEVELNMAEVTRVLQPNSASVLQKAIFYLGKVREFLLEDPREANTEGGVFPAIFGTVLMVILMSVLVTPLGVIAAVYLREYARQNAITRLVRISVNNLAGVPSIVYGMFGLGFFVYFIGGNIDSLFYPESLPAPTFGAGGILWSSLTLALLTMPVVIVATEEGLTRIPKSIREGSLALGATQAETLWRVVLPMSSPALMTGLVLAIARAAGEVAPLMLVGAVKLAPSLALDGNAPFLHLERKFMHLGFHIYDVGFQSPNVEAARPLVYATALLLIVIIMVLNLAAVALRNSLREKYKSLES